MPYLISVGLFAARENGALSTIETVAMHRFGGEAAQQKLGRMVRSGAEDDACGEAFNMLTAGATAGYLVGLAVGQAIGPEALKGSPR